MAWKRRKAVLEKLGDIADRKKHIKRRTNIWKMLKHKQEPKAEILQDRDE